MAVRDYTEAVAILQALKHQGAIAGSDVETLYATARKLSALGGR